MRLNNLKASLKTALYVTGALLLGVGPAVAQQQVSLTAGPASVSLPDGSSVPMWGYSCTALPTGVTSTATCAALSPKAGWSPVVITVPTGSDLQINLTNSLSFSNGNSVPTSLMIVGQLGGGLGTPGGFTAAPDHLDAQKNVTWPIAGTGGGTPPVQGPRVQSFGTEVAAGATTALTWKAPRAGTYLIESGTHPSIQGSMGLYGILVVTTAPTSSATGTAYSGVSYNAEVPLLFSEIDPVQNRAVDTAVNTFGFSETTVWSGQPGGCGYPGSPTLGTCYPPVVNYTPLYYLINGVAFDKTNTSGSLFPVSPATGVTGNVLVRLVNAGSRMHVPAIVGSQTGTAAVPPSGFSLIAEDGNPLPGIPRIQNEVFMAAGKTYDVMLNAPTSGAALPVYDRELSLSGNATARDSGMLAYIGINGAAPVAGNATAQANPDTYNSLIAGQTLTVSDPAKGVIANDVNVQGVALATQATYGTVTLNADGTFSYVPTGTATTDSFGYCANGATAPSTTLCTTVTLGAAPIETAGGITMGDQSYTSKVATFLKIASPGVLSSDNDAKGYPLTVAAGTPSFVSGPGTLGLTVDPKGGFNAIASTPGTYTFTYKAQNSQGTVSSTAATVTLTFPTANGPQIYAVDGQDKKTQITDYRWIIEEDRTFYVDPSKTTNAGASGSTSELTFGTNFHTSYMPVVATGCTGDLSCESGQTVLGQPVVCDVGNGACRTTATNEETRVDPSQVYLDPTKRYYISVLPGDAANPFINTNSSSACLAGSASSGATNCGHGMGGASLANVGGAWVNPGVSTLSSGQVTVLTQPTPFPPAKLAVFVFEDDFPLNGEVDSGGGVDVLAPNEPGLGGFNITIFDDAGGSGDATGQVDYDMFNQPLSNSLAGSIDPSTGRDACPISAQATADAGLAVGTIGSQRGITGQIVTCPKYESGLDMTGQQTLSPLAGQAIVANMMPGRYGIVATPAADRIAAGEEWLQTNTLDGQKAHDSFLRIGEAGYFQEYGPAGYHVSIGFANPKIINARLAGVCNGSDINVTGTNCANTVTGTVTTERMSRTPDERLYSSGSNASFSFTQCYVSIGDPDGEDFSFTKCAADGTFSVSGIPDGNWRVTVFDQWNDMLVDGLSTPVHLAGGSTSTTTNMGDIATNQWQANFNTRTFLDKNGDGISQSNEDGLALIKTNVRYRDGSFSNRNNTDLNGFAAFNEEFPLFSWYVIETDVTRYKNTGTHVVYDAGGPADGTTSCGQTAGSGFPLCGTSKIGAFLANTNETVPLPSNLRVPGAVYCDNADCTGFSIATGPEAGGSSGPGGSTGRIDPPWVLTEGWQGFSGQNNFLEFGKTPYVAGENGGIRGHVIYSSTRPFDDPQFGTQNVWEPLVPNVTINLYQEGTAPDGSQSLTLVDTTKTSSWDDWAQGFRSDGVPNMNCPGQTTADTFFFTLYNQPNWLDVYNNGGTAANPLPDNAQYKCYDGMHNWNQLQPAPYDGMYQFPSVTAMDPVSGKPAGTNCTICVGDPDASDAYRKGTPMLPSGKYVVEVVPPPGYELVKEEDKNILIGDNFIAPVTVQIPGLGSAIYILPDQAEVSSVCNATSSSQNPTCSLGRNQALTSHEGDTPTVDTFWPCVGETRIVPDYISLFPQSNEVAPFAGATRNLCDRKEVTLDDQTSSQAEFFIFTSAHAAAHFTGVITDDFTSEFDPYSPQFGEKFAPPNLPISFKDWTGNEISRVYTDQWGAYNGLTYSTWEVNPPNPTGYSPTMMVTCMNDPGTGTTPDALFNPGYSQFCYEIPFMPGQTQYMDTPVTPTSAFSMGYNHPDCSYPDATPAVSEVDGDGIGPWVSAAGNTLTIKALGDQIVLNNGYSGPGATTAPFNNKTTTRHYGFGGTQGTVTIGTDSVGKPVPATVTGWTDSTITVKVPLTGTSTGQIQKCAIQQQAQYGGSTAYCGQLVITAANGKQSIDSVTVTIGGKAPTHVITSGPMTSSGPGDIQKAIDAAAPGDLIMIDPGTHNEMLLMWKPVRLQGVGAASSVLNANTQPAGKLDQWRQEVNCLFGLALNGQPYTPSSGGNPFATGTGAPSCPATGWAYFTGGPNNPQVDRLPLEGILGWDTTVNGNLAQLLQEPTLMGAYEGAGITVLSKGVNIPSGSTDIFGSGTESAFPTGTTLLTGTSSDCGQGTSGAKGYVKNQYSSNFQCNPSSIDGISITDSSQGGGGVYLHAWAHNMQIANNRIYNNSGTLTGGITIGQGESPDAYLSGTTTDSDPGSCQTTTGDGRLTLTNTQLPYCFDLNVNVHNNSVSLNSSIGDELYSSTPAGGGGVTFCTGADYYKFNYNWVCGNLSTGDGGGLVHLGYIYHGDIEHNSILFNESTNPTVPTNGGGIIAMGAPPDGLTSAGLECGNTVADADCVPGLSDGTGPGLVINANLIEGNAASSGSGGGLRFQGVNGTDVVNFPHINSQWNNVTVTNNIINNNIAGWDGAGVSLQDALNVNLINNTIASNDTTASAGVLFNTLGAPLASSQGPTCTSNCGTMSAPQPAGLVAIQHSAVFASTLTPAITGPTGLTCPTGHPNCGNVSYPLLYNDIFWQNRSFYIGVNGPAPDLTNQQNQVALFNAFTSTGVPNQPKADSTATNGAGAVITGGTGACVSPASYWDLGVRGDTKPAAEAGHIRLAPAYSVLTDTTGYPSTNLNSNPTVVSQYCNGSRTPPELGSAGYQVPPGISDATVPNPIFNLTPAATVDEGNNWVNISWGPLAMTNPVTGATLGNYALASSSPAIDYVPNSFYLTSLALAPTISFDFFGHPRPDVSKSAVDVGAVEFNGNIAPPTLTAINPISGARATTVAVTLTGTNLTGTQSIAVSGSGVTVSGITVVNATTVTANFAIAATATSSTRTVTITTNGGTSGAVAFTVTPPALTSIAPNTGVRGTTVPVTLTGTGLSSETAVNVSGSGITVSGITIVGDTTVTANFAISSGATLSTRTVSVTTPGGTTNTVPFTVTGPTLATIAPNTGIRGSTVPVTLTGSALTGATGVTVTGTGITVNSLVVAPGGATATANFVISGTATVSTRTVSVVTPIGNTNTVTFTVTAPTLTSMTPVNGQAGTSVPVTLTGSSLTGVTAITVSGSGVTASGITVMNDTTVTANLAITLGAAATARNLSVTNAGGATSPNLTFTVTPAPPPTLTSIAPNTGVRGTTVNVTLTGTNLTGATAVAVTGSGVTVSGITVVNATTVTATFTITAGATLSGRNVTVTTPAGTTGTAAFTVQGATLASINPTSGLHNTTVPVILTGTNLAGATAVNMSGTGVTCTAVTSTSTTVSASCAITNGAAHTARTVTATTPIGTTTGVVTFTVN